MDDSKVIEFKKRGSNNDSRPPPPPDLDQDNYKFVVYDRKGNQVEYEKTGHLIVTNVNIALLDEKSELKWSIPNNSDLVYLERIDGPCVTETVDPDFEPEEHLPSEE